MGSKRSLTLAETLVLGRVGTAFGVKGWVHIYSFTEEPDDLLSYPWYLRRPGKAQDAPMPIRVTSAKPHGDHYVAKFEGCDDRDVALSWTNADIVVEKSELTPLASGEYYLSDLIGLLVTNQQGQVLGRVVDFLETGANDVIIVQAEETPGGEKPEKPEKPKEYLIPYVPEVYILEVDLDNRTLQVDWEEDF